MRVKIIDSGLHSIPSYAIITLRNTQYMAISGCEKGESVIWQKLRQSGNTGQNKMEIH